MNKRKKTRDKKSSKRREMQKIRNEGNNKSLLNAKKRSEGNVRRPDDNKRLKILLNAYVLKKRKERPENKEEENKLPKGRDLNLIKDRKKNKSET